MNGVDTKPKRSCGHNYEFMIKVLLVGTDVWIYGKILNQFLIVEKVLLGAE